MRPTIIILTIALLFQAGAILIAWLAAENPDLRWRWVLTILNIAAFVLTLIAYLVLPRQLLL